MEDYLGWRCSTANGDGIGAAWRMTGFVADGQVVLDACGQLARPAAASRGQNQGQNRANPEGFAVPGAPAYERREENLARVVP